MVSFTSTVGLIAAISLVQPIVAGPALAVISAVGTISSIAHNNRRGETDLWTRNDSIKSEFAACMSAAHEGTPPKMVINADKTVDVTGLPAICISEINTYNAQPNIAAMNAAQGKATVNGPNSIHVSGVQGPLTDFLESTAAAQNNGK